MERWQTKMLYRRLFLSLVTIAGLYFLYRVRIIIVPFLFAFFIAYLLNPMIEYLESRKVSRGIAILIVYLGVFGLIAVSVIYGVPHIIQELNKLGQAIPKLAGEVHKIIARAGAEYSSFALPEAVKSVIDETIRDFENRLLNIVRSGSINILKVLSYLMGLLIAPVFAFYILKDLQQIKESVRQNIPRKYRSDVMAVLRDFDEIISGFLRGHLLTSAIVGLLTGLGMYIIGTDFYVIVGIIAGVTELIPYLGPIISAVPAVALALLVSKKMAIYALIVLLIVQQLENAVISPKILGDRLGLHPLVIIFALLAGGELFGFFGLLFAVPLAAAIKVALRYIYLKLVDEK